MHLFVGFGLSGQLPTVHQQPSPVAHGFRLSRFSLGSFRPSHFSSRRRFWTCPASTDTAPSFFAWSRSSSTDRSLFMDSGSHSELRKRSPSRSRQSRPSLGYRICKIETEPIVPGARLMLVLDPSPGAQAEYSLTQP